MPLKATSGTVEIPDGAYLATETKIEKQAATANSPDDSDWLKWFFTVYNSAEGTEMTATSSMRFGPQSKTRAWAEALEGKKFAPGDDWHYEDCKYRDCQVVVKRDDKGFCRIVDVLSAPKSPHGRPVMDTPPDGVRV